VAFVLYIRYGIYKNKMTQESISMTPIPMNNNRGTMLVLSLFFDSIGMLSYLVPVFAEVTDFFWAPISGILLVVMFKGTAGKLAGFFGFIEELLPFVDVIPTFTITWFYTYVISGGKEQE
jgi:hypothetical protein